MELVPAPATGIRGKLSGLLDVVHRLLTTEPARMIGYGAAVAIVGAVSLLNYFGITKFGEAIAFDDAITMAFAAITTVVAVIEFIRRSVASPQTLLNEVVSAYEQGHAAGHAHGEKQVEERTFTIGALQPDDADRRPN